MPLVRGRWFNSDDEAATVPPVVLARDAALALFGTVDCIGRPIDLGGGDPAQRAISRDGMGRIVGVLAAFRKNGELSDDEVRMVFTRTLLQAAGGSVSRFILLRMQPGTAADYEETLLKRLHGVAPNYDLQLQHLEQSRDLMNKLFMAPAIVGGIIAAFLVTMVALGLSGVLWQTVTRRTREIGLRRALGATGAEVNRQILGEVALLATLALVIGVAVVAQLPLIGLFKLVSPASYGPGIAGALATIYGLTLLCGLYPSWLAGRVQPAQALHYE